MARITFEKLKSNYLNAPENNFRVYEYKGISPAAKALAVLPVITEEQYGEVIGDA